MNKPFPSVLFCFLFAVLASLPACESFSDDDDSGGSYGFGGDDDGQGTSDDYADDASDDAAGDDDWYDDDNEDDDDTSDDTAEPEYQCPDPAEPTVLYLSADDSNSQASPVVARAIIRLGEIVPRAKIRTYEFTNYYQIEYDAPVNGHVNVVPQMRVTDDETLNPSYLNYTLQIGVQSRFIDDEDGRPLNLVFSLDTSGSMGGLSIDLEREVMRAIAGRLREGDVVSMVEWDDSVSVRLESHVVDGPNDDGLMDAIDTLEVGGSTDLHSGLVKAYDLAAENYNPFAMNRVVLISDGQANTGTTDIEIISSAADDSEGAGVYLVGVGVGEPYNYYYDTLMDEVTDAGKGAYIFIDTEEEAWVQFGERFQENMEIAAMNVQVELTMPYYLMMAEFHGEEYSENPNEVEPQHLAPNDAMVFHQYLVACDQDLILGTDTIKARATFVEPNSRAEKSDETEMTIEQLLSAGANQLLKGDAVVTYAEGLKQIADLIDTDPAAALAVCQNVRDKAQSAADLLGDEELEEIVDLMDIYKETIEARQ